MFPPFYNIIIYYSDQESIVIDLTKLTLTPKERWTPEHSMQIKIPLLTDTHELNDPGLNYLPQSMQWLF